MGHLSHLHSWPQLVYRPNRWCHPILGCFNEANPFPRCQWGSLTAWRLQLLADTPISRTSQSNTSHSSCWLITRPFRLRERSGGWRCMGAKRHLPDLKTYVTPVYTDWNMLIWEIPSRKKSWNTDQNRLREWNACWCCTNAADGKWNCRLFPLCPSPLSAHPSIHLVIYPSAAEKAGVGMQATWSF